VATLTWVGGGNNRANNPNDWSPNSAPEPGDSLAIAGGIMNIVGSDLAGDTLSLSLGGPFPYLGPITLNLSHHAVLTETLDPYGTGKDVTFNLSNSTLNLLADGSVFGSINPVINLSGADTFDFSVGAGSGGTINLSPNSTWTGDIYVHALGNHDYGGNVTVNGASNASFRNQASEIDSGHTTINANVVGIGSFGMGLKDSYGGYPATLEFAGSVGYGQTITMSDASHTSNSGLLLQVDKPLDFHGSVTLVQGSIDLMGLVTADSYSFKNDMLSIFSGSTVIDTLRLHDSTQFGFAVERTATSVNVVAISDPTNPPVGLPIHAV
jgi:hypothetical protein